MTIKLYDAVRQCIRAQINMQTAQHSLSDPANIDSHRDNLRHNCLHEALYMSLGVLARLDVINDPMNDQAQTSARELIGVLSQRLDIDVEDKFGVPLKSRGEV
jgi:hypothetical protein